MNDTDRTGAPRPTFTSGVAAVLTMVGVAIGLGNFWRFPYLVGRFGGAAFVLFYLVIVLAIGVPGLMAEWTLGRHSRRGTVGAFGRAGLPGGRAVGWFLFAVVIASSAYYTNAVGWVLGHAIASLLTASGLPSFDAARALPPESGFSLYSFLLQIGLTATVLSIAGVVLSKGVRNGIEATSRVLIPALFGILLILIVRGLTLPGAGEGVRWYLLKFRIEDLTGSVMVAALGQVVFSLGLGGTFMVVYGSYLADSEPLPRAALITATADTVAGLLAGLAIFPAVFALGLEPGSGPGLIFATLPSVFSAIPAGQIFAALFFTGLFSAALLSDIAAFEVLVAGITDNTHFTRRRAIATILLAIMVLALAPMINMRVFVPWDLTFGSGMQTLGALLSAIAAGWSIHRSIALEQMGVHGRPAPRWLYMWLRFAVPGCILVVGVWWLLSDVLHVVGGV